MFKPIRDIVRAVVLILEITCRSGDFLNILRIDSDWLPAYKCQVINQSELLLKKHLWGLIT